MIWIGIAIGIIFASTFGMALLVIVSKQKSDAMPKQLTDFWEKSLMNQRNQFHAIASIADALTEQRLPNISKMVDRFINQRNQFHAIASIADALTEQRLPNISKMVDRFLAWPLPKDFAPDGGISFKNEPDARGYNPSWPVGTNLFTANQARQMFEHVLGEAIRE